MSPAPASGSTWCARWSRATGARWMSPASPARDRPSRSTFPTRSKAPPRRPSPPSPSRKSQECQVFEVPSNVANQPELQGETSDAALEIPADWLMPGIDLDAVREAQRPDTIATLSANHLSLKGVELVVERRWLREAFWRQARQAITRGYIYRSSAGPVMVRGEGRGPQRPNTPDRRTR